MNNLLKIFLIFNLVSSAASSANNFSVPLPERELKVGQNSSELVERGGPITMVGGTTVQGIWMNSDGSTLQRPCTLGFPVKNDGGYLGFLTSYACSNSNFFFVGNTEVGTVLPPYAFTPSKGLDYMFVLAYNGFWEDKVSENMLYSSQCGEDELLPIIPSADKTLVPNSKVCTFGGLKNEMVCGRVLEFDVTIQVPRPGTDGQEFVDFPKVVKVSMNSDYDLGYMGAPVYIPLSVPNSTEFVVDPVGQIVETLAQYRDDENQDKKIWYYIPLDRILEYSGVKLLSSLLIKKEESPFNQNEVPLSDGLTVGRNDSDTNLVRRQPNEPQAVDVHAGFRMWIFKGRNNVRPPLSGDDAKKCTLGFAVRKVFGNNRFDHGFLTLGSCMHSDRGGITNSIFYTPTQEWIWEEAIRLGTVSGLIYGPTNGLNYALVRLRPNDAQYALWNDDVSADMLVDNAGQLEFVAVSNQPYPQNGLTANQELCWWGSSSEHMCGTIEHPSTTLTKLNPWRWPIYVNVVIPLIANNQPIPVELRWSPDDTFQNLIKVRLNEDYQPHAEEGHKSDSGAPVYYPFFNRFGLITQVKPVGILLDYVLETENRNDQCVVVWYMYCISVDRIMSDLNANPSRGRYELIGENI